jgi:hypothetical protein
MIKKGTKVSWKVSGYPDAKGMTLEDEEDGHVLIGALPGEEEESGASYQDISIVTVIDQ